MEMASQRTMHLSILMPFENRCSHNRHVNCCPCRLTPCCDRSRLASHVQVFGFDIPWSYMRGNVAKRVSHDDTFEKIERDFIIIFYSRFRCLHVTVSALLRKKRSQCITFPNIRRAIHKRSIYWSIGLQSTAYFDTSLWVKIRLKITRQLQPYGRGHYCAFVTEED
jgi:hypothetical protein